MSKSNTSTPTTEKPVEGAIVAPDNMENSGLVPLNSQIVAPVVTPEQSKEAWKQFQATKKALLEESDYQVLTMMANVKGHWEKTTKPFVKKAGWRKLATAFNLSDYVVKEARLEYAEMPYKEKEGTVMKAGFVWEMTVRAIAPNGRFAEGVGSCASNERGFAHVEHDVRATAMTRAKNRAISDLIGGGEVSAEEMEGQENAKELEKTTKIENCTQDHEAIETRNVQKEGRNKGRPYKYCRDCGWGRWEDTHEEWLKKEERKEDVQKQEDDTSDELLETAQRVFGGDKSESNNN